MIGYEEITSIEVAQDKDAWDAFYSENGISGGDITKVAFELANVRMQELQEGAILSSDVLGLALSSMYLLGFETAWRLRSES